MEQRNNNNGKKKIGKEIEENSIVQIRKTSRQILIMMNKSFKFDLS